MVQRGEEGRLVNTIQRGEEGRLDNMVQRGEEGQPQQFPIRALI